MKHVLFCALVDLASTVGIVGVCWMVWKGCTAWVIPVALLMALHIVIPGRETTTCPHCGKTIEIEGLKHGGHTYPVEGRYGKD